MSIVKVKRSDGTYDYFEGNNGDCRPFGSLTEQEKKDFRTDNYQSIAVWMAVRPKEFLNDKIEKEAYKYGQEANKNFGPSTDLTKLLQSLNARNLRDWYEENMN